jgi:hypothetical protein
MRELPLDHGGGESKLIEDGERRSPEAVAGGA